MSANHLETIKQVVQRLEPIIEKIDFDISRAGYNLCIVDTGGNHADLIAQKGTYYQLYTGVFELE